MKYHIVTFGCRVNQADSLAIEGQLRERGGAVTAAADADLLVVNTCSVTAGADQGARQTIRRIVRQNPDVKVIVTGCYATRRPDELAALPNVVQVIANPQKDSLVGPHARSRSTTSVSFCGLAMIWTTFGSAASSSGRRVA